MLKTLTVQAVNSKLSDIIENSKGSLDVDEVLTYCEILRSKIIAKDQENGTSKQDSANSKQDKVNLIVVLPKLIECLIKLNLMGEYNKTIDFTQIFDFTLFSSLFSILSKKISNDIYKPVLDLVKILISGILFNPKNDSIDKYLPLYESIINKLDVIDIMSAKIYSQDNKITLTTIKIVNDLIVKALKFEYNGIITLAGRLKHVGIFNIIGNLIETSNTSILSAIEDLKSSYYRLNEFLNRTKFDLSIKSHRVMLDNLFAILEFNLNEYGTQATTEEYIKAGFTDNPKRFVVDNFTILLAMDLKIFLKDSNMTFKKKFHEELMMSDHNRTFPLCSFIDKCTELWIEIFHSKNMYPNIFINILSWELMIFYTMNSCLTLWQETNSKLQNIEDIEKIMLLIKDNIDLIENDLMIGEKNIEECLDLSNYLMLRTNQISNLKLKESSSWNLSLNEFNKNLSLEVMDFVCEQRVIQLLKGSWVYTESFGEVLMKQQSKKLSSSMIPNTSKYYFILLSPNRQYLYYKEFSEKTLVKPNYEEMEQQSIKLSDIVDFKSIKIGDQIGEEDKRKNSRLISIKGTISYEKITLLGSNGKKLLGFYTDTEVNKYVWLDGLKMLKMMIKPGQLSLETEKQLDTLVDIRRNTQLLNLNEVTPVNDDSDDDEYYDINELVDVSDDFYYR